MSKPFVPQIGPSSDGDQKPHGQAFDTCNPPVT